MEIYKITPRTEAAIGLLGARCYSGETACRALAADEEDRQTILALLLEKAAGLARQYGLAYCCMENGEPVAFALWVDWRRAAAHHAVGPGSAMARALPAALEGIARFTRRKMRGHVRTFHLLALAVREDHRGAGLASYLTGLMRESHPDWTLTMTVTNLRLLAALEKAGATTEHYGDGCAFCVMRKR